MNIDSIIKEVLIGLVLALACLSFALFWRANTYKAERDLARQQVIAFNGQLNQILQDYQAEAIKEAKIEKTAKEQKNQYLATILDLQNANLTGDCMQAVGYMVDSGKELH